MVDTIISSCVLLALFFFFFESHAYINLIKQIILKNNTAGSILVRKEWLPFLVMFAWCILRISELKVTDTNLFPESMQGC